MIRIGNYSPHRYLEDSHIGAYGGNYSANRIHREVPGQEIKKIDAVYVGKDHVYPELYRYTLKYKSKLNFTFTGNSYGGYRPTRCYAETITTGYVEDTVRIDSVFPTYITAVLLSAPDDYYTPHVGGHSKYGYPPWGMIEMYKEFSGTEYLIMPVLGLLGRPIDTGNHTADSIFLKYMSTGSGSIIHDLNIRIILERTVHSHTLHPVLRSWDYYDNEEEYTTHYTIQARKTGISSDESKNLTRGYYINGGNISKIIAVQRDIHSRHGIGFTYRPEGTPGGEGVYLFTDTELGPTYGEKKIFVGASSEGYRFPGYISTPYNRSCSIMAPPFNGHKHFDCYDSSWNAGRQEITSWEDPQMDLWSHLDFDGTVTILENNNPIFTSIAEYVQAYMNH